MSKEEKYRKWNRPPTLLPGTLGPKGHDGLSRNPFFLRNYTTYFVLLHPKGEAWGIRPQSSSQEKRSETVGTSISMKPKPYQQEASWCCTTQQVFFVTSDYLEFLVENFASWGVGEKQKWKRNAIFVLSISSLSLLIKITFPERFLLSFYPWKASLKFWNIKWEKSILLDPKFCSMWLPVQSANY